MREISLKSNVETDFFQKAVKWPFFFHNFKKKAFFGLCEAWTSIKRSFLTFYFYFFRRKTNDESRYLSGLRFLILLFTEPNQHWITVCKLISILNFTFSVAKPNVEKRPCPAFTFFSGPKKHRKTMISDQISFSGSPRDFEIGFPRAIRP